VEGLEYQDSADIHSLSKVEHDLIRLSCTVVDFARSGSGSAIKQRPTPGTETVH